MDLDITVARPSTPGPERRQVATLTGPSAGDGGYLTGGIPVDPAEVRMGKIFAILGAVISDGSAIRVGWYNVATEKLMFFVPDTGAEVANATDLSTFSGRVEFVGQ